MSPPAVVWPRGDADVNGFSASPPAARRRPAEAASARRRAAAPVRRRRAVRISPHAAGRGPGERPPVPARPFPHPAAHLWTPRRAAIASIFVKTCA